MSEYIDFEVARKYLHEACSFIGSNGGLMLKIKFDQEPKADVVEVVPCKDCFYAKPYNKKWRLPVNENRFWCEHHNEEKEPNWFCADAIRREDV